jgi:hypothetical protein
MDWVIFTNLNDLLYSNPMQEHEKEGTIYILAIIGFIALILILVSLTHVVLP